MSIRYHLAEALALISLVGFCLSTTAQTSGTYSGVNNVQGTFEASSVPGSRPPFEGALTLTF